MHLYLYTSYATLTGVRAESLFNAVKKQYGLHSYLLQLSLPTSPLPQPVPVPLPIPRLPPLSTFESSPVPPSQFPGGLAASSIPNPGILPPRSPEPTAMASEYPQVPVAGPGMLLLCQDDIQIIGRFIREFLVMSLIPWMEKCVLEWNDSVRRNPPP